MNFDISETFPPIEIVKLKEEAKEQTTDENPYGIVESVTTTVVEKPIVAILNEDYVAKFNNASIKYCDCLAGIPEYVEVLFKCTRKNIFRNVNNLSFVTGQFVIVEVENGTDFGTVSACGKAADDRLRINYNGTNTQITQKVVRHASKDDYEKHLKNLDEDISVVNKTREMIAKYNFDMKITEAEWQFDRQRLTIFFTAPSRIDFRELVKELARTFKTRIELRQISTREEAKRIGGMGSCGRMLCCSSFSCDFNHVTLDHARTQQLSNNVAKLSGYCGRLKCCLLYEYDNYVDAFKKYPPLNSQIVMPEGLARIIKADVFKDIFYLHIESVGIYKSISLAEIEELMRTGRVIAPKESGTIIHPDFEEDIEELKKLEDR